MDVCSLSVDAADEFFATLKLTEFQEKIAHEIIKEIRARLGFLKNVGLGYLTLNRESGTLERRRSAAHSPGHADRRRAWWACFTFSTSRASVCISATMTGCLRTLEGLRDLGNSVLVVEHDADTIRHADYILDLGPGAGVRGGEIVAAGTLAGSSGQTPFADSEISERRTDDSHSESTG